MRLSDARLAEIRRQALDYGNLTPIEMLDTFGHIDAQEAEIGTLKDAKRQADFWRSAYERLRDSDRRVATARR